MFINDFLHYIFGCVTIKAENGFIERFINTCTAEGIPLWDMRKNGGTLTAKTDINGYKRIRLPAKKSGMRVRMTAKQGLPFLIHRRLKRPGLIAGFAILFAALFLLSGHIWVIKVDVPDAASRAEILAAYENAGLKIGSRKSRLELTAVETDALLQLDSLSWTTVNINGCVAEIKVRGVSSSPEVEKLGNNSNIIASKDGQVQIIEPYRGTAAVKPGQTVKKGDLLISGITENKLLENLFTDANGYAAASTALEVSCTVPITQPTLVPYEKKLYSVFFLGKELPPAPKRESDITYFHKARMTVSGVFLPFGTNYRRFTSFEKAEKKVSPAQAGLTAINNYHLKAYCETLHAQIISQKVTVTRNGSQVKISGVYECYENIGERCEFGTEETPLNETGEN